MTKVVAIVQARMGSARFPGKVLADLCGKPMIQYVLDAAWAVRVTDVVLATTTSLVDDPLADWCERQRSGFAPSAKLFRGSEHDVLKRFYDVASLTGADVIVRLTGDCPLLDRRAITDAILFQEHTRAEFVTNDTRVSGWMDGTDVEVFTYEALSLAHRAATDAADREHVTHWLLNNRPHLVMMKRPAMTGPKLSVDTPEDLETVRAYLQAQQRAFA